MTAHTSHAITTMKRELDKILIMMNDCATEDGHIKSECRYRYQMLVEQATAFKTSLSWLEEMYSTKV